MTAIVDIAEFRSDSFAPVLPEESQVNPEVYGAELAFWLCVELAKRGVVTTYPEYEDWGWYVEYFPASGSEFAVQCVNVEGTKDHWLLSLRRHARKMFGRDKPPFSEVAGLVLEIKKLLEEEPTISQLNWQYSDEDAN